MSPRLGGVSLLKEILPSFPPLGGGGFYNRIVAVRKSGSRTCEIHWEVNVS